MGDLKNIREMLGLSQSEMAGLLGLKKGQVAMAETGQRRLPAQARKFVAWMADFLDQHPETEPSQDFSPENIRKEIRKLEARLGLLRLQLEMQEEKFQQTQRLKEVCENLEPAFPGAVTELMRKSMDTILFGKSLKLENNRNSPTVFLRAEIKGLEAMIAELTGQILD